LVQGLIEVVSQGRVCLTDFDAVLPVQISEIIRFRRFLGMPTRANRASFIRDIRATFLPAAACGSIKVSERRATDRRQPVGMGARDTRVRKKLIELLFLQ
jgi:hypothetical protein